MSTQSNAALANSLSTIDVTRPTPPYYITTMSEWFTLFADKVSSPTGGLVPYTFGSGTVTAPQNGEIWFVPNPNFGVYNYDNPGFIEGRYSLSFYNGIEWQTLGGPPTLPQASSTVAGLVKLGTGMETNTIADGEWEDLQVSVQLATGGSALAVVTFRDTPATMLAFSDIGSDNLTFFAQMSHKWDVTTSVRPHIHWVPRIAVSAPSTVIFTGQYAWARPFQQIPANADWTTFSITANLVPGDEYKHFITPIATVPPPPSAEASDILIVHLNRDGGADTYNDGTNNVGILSLDVHYQANRLGTVSEY